MKHTKQKILFLIADEIQAINYNARNKLKIETALNKALKEGDKIDKTIKELVNELPQKEKEKIIILRWSDLMKSLERKQFLNELSENYNKKENFHKGIVKIVREYTSKEKREFSLESLHKMEKYLIEELPEFLKGILYERNYFNLYVYPKDNRFFKFVQQIQDGKIKLKLTQKLPTEKIAFVVVN